MRVVGAAEIAERLSYPGLVDILEEAFRTGAHAPQRHHHQIALPGRPEATLLLMPAWSADPADAASAGRYIGIKSVTVFPDNNRKGKPAVYGAYLLLSTETGEPLALLDAPSLTVWRTAAASALAARYLARADAKHLLMVGAGALAPYLVRAHASVRPIERVTIWNRTPAHAERLAAELTTQGIRATVAGDLAMAVEAADIVSAATISATPLVRGAWLRPGTHVDCVGAFRPDMRETDDDTVRRARIWVDTWAGGLAEAGDIVAPLAAGVIDRTRIVGNLADLCRGRAPGRGSDDEITMFKSVGAAIEDLAAAVAVYEQL